MRGQKTAQAALWCLAGALIGYLAWHPGAQQWWLLLLPALWSRAPTRMSAYLAWVGYYMAGARDAPTITSVFFPELWHGLGAVIWLAHASILALPWIWAWKMDASPRQAALRAFLALLATTVPPWGILAWLNPLLLAGLAFPGSGWWGLGLTMVMLASVAGYAREPRGTGLGARALVAIAFIATMAFANWRYQPHSPPSDWFAAQTALGRYPAETSAGYQRQLQLIESARKGLKRGAKVIVFPEEIAGKWRPAVEYWWRQAAHEASSQGATIILGADMPTGGERYFNGARLLGGEEVVLRGRVPMPIGVWRPGFSKSGEPDLLGSGVHRVHGRRIALSICYEDFLLYPLLLSTLHAPELIVSMANNWYARDLAAIWIQQRSIDLQARLHALPLVRSVNTGEIGPR